MNQALSQYPKAAEEDKENQISPAIPPNAGNFNRTVAKMSSSFAPDTSAPQENDLLEQDRRLVRTRSVYPHPGHHSQGSDYPLGEMSLMTLAEYCTQENNKYQHNEPSDERYGLEIFRRAVTLNDHDAWATLQHQFSGHVRFWLAHHMSREVALRYETEQEYIDHTFQRFWQAVRDQALTFTSLAGALRYLRLCLHCTIMDTLRVYTYHRLEMLPKEGHPDEPQVEDRYHESELWETISNLLVNEQECRLAYLHFHCNLKPREIVRHCPGEFSSEEEIYRIKRNIMTRIMRNIDKIRWRLS